MGKISKGMVIQSLLTKVAFGIVLISVVLLSLEYTLFGYICLFSLILISNYVSKLEKKANVGKKIEIIGLVVYVATTIIGLLLIL